MLKHYTSAYLLSLSHPFPAEVVGTGDHGPGEMIADNEEKQTVQAFVTNDKHLAHASSCNIRQDDSLQP